MAARFTVRRGADDPRTVSVDGSRVTIGATSVDVARVAAGTYRVSDGARTRTLHVAGPLDARWVFCDGRVFQLEVAPEGRGRRRAGGGDEALMAPMPATVVSVHASPGQAVEAGDVLLMLEAMKMELPVKAPRDGIVRTVRCQPGDLVQPGQPLIDLA